MALFEDRRKPVDLYKEGSPAEVAQGNMNRFVGKAVNTVTTPAQTAINKGVLAPAKNLATRVVAPVAQAITRPIVAGRERQQRFMAGQAVNANATPAGDRQAIGALMGPGYERKVGGVGVRGFNPTAAPTPAVTRSKPNGMVSNIGQERGTAAAAILPQPQSFTPQRDGIQSQRIDPATQQSFRRAMVPPRSTAAEAMAINAAPTQTVYTNNGDKVTTEQQPRRIGAPPDRSIGRRVSMNQQAGNLDIQFDPGTDEQSIRRFMEDPVRPTAAINRFNTQQRTGPSQGQIASMNAEQVINPDTPKQINTFGDILNTKREMAGQRLDQSERQVDNQFATAQMNDATNREQNSINRFSNEATARNNADKNQIDRETLAAGQPVRDAQAKYYGAQTEDLPARRAVDERRLDVEDRKVGVYDERNRITEEKNQLDAIEKIEDPIEKASVILSGYDPEGPPSQMKARGQAAAKQMGSIIGEEYKEMSGMFSGNPVPEIVEKFFPPNMSPTAARAIVDSITNEDLRKKVGGYLRWKGDQMNQ